MTTAVRSLRMPFLENIDPSLPAEVRTRLEQLRQEIDKILDAAMRHFATDIPNRIAFRLTGNSSANWGGDLMPQEERAQAISFVVRYEHLPIDVKVRLGKVDGEWHIRNLGELRHVLNDFRPIIQNQNDLTFYTNVNATVQKRLRRSDPAQGLRLQAFEGDSDKDVSAAFAQHLGESTKAIATLLGALEYDYLFNGVLQHSDPQYSTRFVRDYTTGEFNYILWKHVAVLGQIHYWLTPFYRVLRLLNFPSLGSLVVKAED